MSAAERIHVEADAAACIGSGSCVALAPHLFDQDPDEGTVVVLKAQASGEDAAFARSAAQMCPAVAIAVHVVE